MKKYYMLVHLLFCLMLWSCAHSPVNDFNKVAVGDDKEAVLSKTGSPLRSKHREGKDVWTYRFVKDSGYDYKDIVFENQKVIEIKNSPEVDMLEVTRKERILEKNIKTQRSNEKLFEKVERNKKSEKPSTSESILEQKSAPKRNDTFVPVE